MWIITLFIENVLNGVCSINLIDSFVTIRGHANFLRSHFCFLRCCISGKQE